MTAESLVRELMFETRMGNLERVQELLQHSEIDVNLQIDGRRALADAIQAKDVDILKAYLDSGKVDLSLWVASFSSLEDRGSKPFECFTFKCKRQQRKFNVDCTISAFMFAIELGEANKVKMLIEHGASLKELTEKSQETPLLRAFARGNYNVIQAVALNLQKHDLTRENKHGMSAMKALIYRPKVSKPCPFTFYDMFTESVTKYFTADNTVQIIADMLRSHMDCFDLSYGLAWMLLDAATNENCIMTQDAAIKILKLLHESGFKYSDEKNILVHLLDQYGTFIQIDESLGTADDLRSYLQTSQQPRIKVILEWLKVKPELKPVFDEHFVQIGQEKIMALFREDAAELVGCFEEYIWPLLSNEALQSALIDFLIASPAVDFDAFIKKLVKAKENAFLRKLNAQAQLLFQQAIKSKHLSAVTFILKEWYLDPMAEYDGNVPLYVAAEFGDCSVLQKLVEYAKAGSFDKAELAKRLRHSPCTCAEARPELFDFDFKRTIEKTSNLHDLLSKIDKEESDQAPIDDSAVVTAVLSGQDKNWKQLKPIIERDEVAFTAICFESTSSSSSAAPIHLAKKSKFRLVKLFSCLARNARGNSFQLFVSDFEKVFPGYFAEFLKEFGAYLLVNCRHFLTAYVLIILYDVPVDARVHSFQGSYSLPARVFSNAKFAVFSQFLTNFTFDFNALNWGNQTLRRVIRRGNVKPDVNVLKRLQGVKPQDVLAYLDSSTAKDKKFVAFLKKQKPQKSLMAAYIRSLNEVKSLNLAIKSLNLATALLKIGADPLIRVGQKTWLTDIFVRLSEAESEDLKRLRKAGLKAMHVACLTDEVGKRVFHSDDLYDYLAMVFPYTYHYIDCDLKYYKNVVLDEILGEKEKCTICHSNYEAEDVVFPLPCHHLFHHECLTPLNDNGMWGHCPYCRKETTWSNRNRPDDWYPQL